MGLHVHAQCHYYYYYVNYNNNNELKIVNAIMLPPAQQAANEPDKHTTWHCCQPGSKGSAPHSRCIYVY